MDGRIHRGRHAYLLALGGLWLLLNLLGARATYNVFVGSFGRPELTVPWTVPLAYVLFPFDVHATLPWVDLWNVLIACAFISAIMWRRSDAPFRAGWLASAVYVICFGLLSPGATVLVANTKGLDAALHQYLSYRGELLLYYVLVAVVANVLSALLLVVVRRLMGARSASRRDESSLDSTA